MKLSESLELKGKLTIHKIDSQNEICDEIIANNDITLSGRKLVAQLFSPENAAKPVDKIKLGIGKQEEFDANPEDLVDSVGSINIEPIDFQNDIKEENNRIKLTLRGHLEENNVQVNNKPLTEACLYSSVSKVMYNRVEFLPITKTENFKLTLIWEILF